MSEGLYNIHIALDYRRVPEGWTYVGDLMRTNVCIASIFITNKGRIRIQRPAGSFEDDAVVVDATMCFDTAPVEIEPRREKR